MPPVPVDDLTAKNSTPVSGTKDISSVPKSLSAALAACDAATKKLSQTGVGADDLLPLLGKLRAAVHSQDPEAIAHLVSEIGGQVELLCGQLISVHGPEAAGTYEFLQSICIEIEPVVRFLSEIDPIRPLTPDERKTVAAKIRARLAAKKSNP